MKALVTASGALAVLAIGIVPILLGGCASSPDGSAARALVIQTDGRLVAGGVRCVGKECDFALGRYLPDGGLDTSFGSGGKVVTRFVGSVPGAASRFPLGSFARAVVVQPDGKLVAAGVVRLPGFKPAWALARYLPDGRMDHGFGSEGMVTTTIAGSHMSDYAVPAITQQPDGKLVLASHDLMGGTLDGSRAQLGFVLIRYLPDGRIDFTFGQNGSATTAFAGSFVSARAVSAQPDGKLVAAGFALFNELDHFALARYLPDGRLDRSFGEGGVAATAVSYGAKGQIVQGFLDRGAFGLVLQPDGRLIAVGATEGLKGRTVFALARFLPDGNLDRSFGTAGTVATDFGDGGVAFAAALQPDGKVVVVGTTGIAELPVTDGKLPCEKFALARYLPNGALDSSFGTEGKVIGEQCGRPMALGIQPDGKLVVAGRTVVAGPAMFTLARYLPDGSLDSAFGTGGKVTTEFSEEKPGAAGLPR